MLAGSVSSLVALVAAGLPCGSRVLVANDEFLSATLPFRAREQRSELRLRRALREELAQATIAHAPRLVVASLVRAQDGDLLDSEALARACESVGSRLLLDVSQCGWMPLAGTHADALVGVGHKWLMGPHGTAFLVAGNDMRLEMVPLNSGWTARRDTGSPPWGPSEIAQDARGFDQSPAFLPWVVQAAALELVERLTPEAIASHDLALACDFANALGLAEPQSPIVTIPARRGDPDRLASAGVRATHRAGHLRFSFHLHNDQDDVAAALKALGSC